MAATPAAAPIAAAPVDNLTIKCVDIIEDIKLRESINGEYQGFSDAGIAKIEIDRGTQDTVINIHSARPGILIGREGERVKNLRSRLEEIAEHRIQLNIIEIEQPELNPYLVGRNIAEQLQRRVAYRRAIRQAAQRAMQAGAQGIKIIVKGIIFEKKIAKFYCKRFIFIKI